MIVARALGEGQHNEIAGECGHLYRLILQQHKGQNYMWVEAAPK